MKLSKLKAIIFTLCLVVLLSSCFLVSVRADDQGDKLGEKQKEIEEYQRKIDELQSQQKTLKSTIAYFENKIRLTVVLIDQNEEKLKVLEKEIEQLSLKIGRLDESLETISRLLVLRIIETYKKGTINPLYLFLTSDGFSQFLNRYKYLKIVQAHDRDLLFKMEQARFNYDSQKTLKEEKQEEVERLKLQLEKQKLALAQQRKDKERLLEITKNDEERYQELLVVAQAEYEAILAILAGKGEVAEVGPIKAGEIISSMIVGASACSIGTHLHFEVVVDGSSVNPASYLKSTNLIFEPEVQQFNGSGSWDWPIFDPIRITQEYGETFWTRLGRLWYDFHTGIDMVSGTLDNPGSRTARAVQDGTLYRGSIDCGGGTLKYSRVDQADDIQTYYLHVN